MNTQSVALILPGPSQRCASVALTARALLPATDLAGASAPALSRPLRDPAGPAFPPHAVNPSAPGRIAEWAHQWLNIMSDVLSEAERAAIAAFKGKVKRIPQGQTGGTLTGGVHWKKQRDGVMRRMARDMKFKALKRRERAPEPKPGQQMVMVTPPTTVVQVKKERKPRPAATKMKEIIAGCDERRARTRELMLSGMTRAAAAKALGISVGSVANDINALRARGELPPPNPNRKRCGRKKAGRCGSF